MNSLLYTARLASACALGTPRLLPRTIHPVGASLKVTGRCNSRCVTCTFWRSAHKDGITTERAKRLLAEVRDLGIRQLCLTGGEPLLRDDLFDILGVCDATWFDSLQLATNGLLLARFADQINKSPITDVVVSLDAIGGSNDEIRGVPGAYEQIIGALPSIHKSISVRSLLTGKLIPHLAELIRYCKEHGYRYGVGLLETEAYCFSSPESRESVEALWPSEDDIRKGLDLLSDSGIMVRTVLANSREYLASHKFLFKHCILGYTSVYIQSTGDVRAGCNVYRPVGSILEKDLKSIVDSPAYHESAKKMYELDCPLCTCGYGTSAMYNSPGREFIPFLWRRIARLLPN